MNSLLKMLIPWSLNQILILIEIGDFQAVVIILRISGIIAIATYLDLTKPLVWKIWYYWIDDLTHVRFAKLSCLNCPDKWGIYIDHCEGLRLVFELNFIGHGSALTSLSCPLATAANRVNTKKGIYLNIASNVKFFRINSENQVPLIGTNFPTSTENNKPRLWKTGLILFN